MAKEYNATMSWFTARMCVFSLLVMLLAPALRVRFEFMSEVLAYFIPMGVFLVGTLTLSIMGRTYFFERISASLVYLLFFIPPFLAFFIGGAQEFQLLLFITLNCGLGVLIVLFPWNLKLLNEFMWGLALIGALLAINTILYAGSSVALELVSEIVRTGYLSVTFAAGMACIASLHLVLTKITPVTVSLFALNWVGVALGRGRGAFLVCVIVTAIYLAFYLLNNRSTQRLSKKLIIVVLFALVAPFVFSKVISLNTGKWERLFLDFGAEYDQGGRGALAEVALQRISQQPVFGHGLGEYMIGGHPHNIFLQFGIDSGFVGMAFVLGFFVVLTFIGIKNYRSLQGDYTSLGYAVIALVVYMFLNFLKSGDSYLGRELYILTALPIALAMTIKILKRKQ